MIFALLGGDERSVRLAGQLQRDGHEVRSFALEKALPNYSDSPAELFAGVDAIVLPLPCEKDGALNAPLSAVPYRFSDLLHYAAPATPVCAGKAGEALKRACDTYALPLHDYFLREDFTLQNAELTAEGVLPILLDSPRALRGSEILICGYGRIARFLAAKLRALGAVVTVAARKSADRALAKLQGCRAVDLPAATAGRYDAVVNTIPAPVFGKAEIAAFGEAKLVELASAPYGFDLSAGKDIILASGLPGKTAAEAAAAAVKHAIYAIMEVS